MRKRKEKKARGFAMRQERKRVFILTPCGDDVKTEYAMSMIAMIQHTNNGPPKNLEACGVKALGTSILPKGREQLLDAALEAGATHILWIDSDMKFPADMLLRFLKRDEPVVGVNCMARRPPHRCTAQYDDGTQVKTTRESTGIEKVARVGTGILWLDVRVIEHMKRPYFSFVYLPSTSEWLGEDFFFMRSLKDLGFDVYVDHDLSKEVLHVGSFGYNPMLSEVMGVL